MQGRQTAYANVSFTTQAKVHARDDSEVGNPFHMPFFPDNIQWADFPDDYAIRSCAASGLFDAWRLADAAVRALSQDVLPNSFARYFQADQLCIVRKVFQAILELSGQVPRTLKAVERVYTFYYDEKFIDFDTCESEYALAYHIHEEDSDDEEDPAIVLCPRLFVQRSQPLDDINCDAVKASTYIRASEAKIGFILLHELTHDFVLTREAAGIEIDDSQFYDPNIWAGGKPGVFVAYGPYWSQYANDIYWQGVYNADNYAYFAFEVFLAEHCELGLNGFVDAPYDTNVPEGGIYPF